jgi:NAD(P)-dependent dehydrogenase (short-subunit alcohol dehydrogenase family)
MALGGWRDDPSAGGIGYVTPTVAVVTGGSRGIGAATCVELARSGRTVCFSYRDQHDAAQRTVAECRDFGVTAEAVGVDSSTEDGVEKLFARASELGAVTVVVNNAAIVTAEHRVVDLDAASLLDLIRVNVFGPMLCARAGVRAMSSRLGGAGGVIVNVSSRSAVTGSPGRHVDYACTKAAIETLTVGLAAEVAPDGVRVVAVRPGPIATGIHDVAGPSSVAKDLAATVAMGRLGTPAEVGGVIAWLCSPAASFVSGAVIDVHGAGQPS